MPKFNITPLHDVEVLNTSTGKNVYYSKGQDPCFNIELMSPLKKGWYSATIGIEDYRNKIRASKLYFDTGKGYNENETILLPPIQFNSISSHLFFPEDVISLRFDPTILKDAEFSIENVTIEATNTIKPANASGTSSHIVDPGNIQSLTSDNLKIALQKAFDKEYYLSNNTDIKAANINPFDHYFNQGWREGRRPNNWFNPIYYLNTYKDVQTEPLTHYLTIGLFEGRKPMVGDSSYYHHINQQNRSDYHKNSFIEFEKHDKVDVDLRLIAFYLPQYHPIPQNDKAWGKGFTEWTNVSKAIPQFEGHYQPRLPGELGYYDLRLVDIQRRQIELAKNYGLHGFCYHYYWFAGKKIMDTPIQQILDNPDLDFPFCINWANENWTKKWDGLDNDVILQQNHSPEDDIAFLEAIKPILTDKRYIRVSGKPLLMIYRPNKFPNIKATVKRWREHAKKIGIGDLYLVLTHSFDSQNPVEIGFDAATEFPPNNFNVTDITGSIDPYNSGYKGRVYDYTSLLTTSSTAIRPDYIKFRGICPSWDNEARKPGNGGSIHGSTPKKYETWLEYLCYYTEEHRTKDEKIIFVNAWNEWGEGTYLEPDRKYGYAYLETTYKVLEKFDKQKQRILASTQNVKKTADIAVVLHLYYVDLWSEMKSVLANFKDPFDLFININNSASISDIEKIRKDYPNAHIYSFENRGRDILPFVKTLEIILPLDYKYICKLHSKKSLHRQDGDNWRKHLIHDIIGSPERIKESIQALNNKDIGVVVSRGNSYAYREWIGSNVEIVENLAKKANIKVPDDFIFPAGSIFWFSPRIFKGTENLVHADEFPIENGQMDGTIAHAYERIVGLLCAVHNCKIVSLEEPKSETIAKNKTPKTNVTKN